MAKLRQPKHFTILPDGSLVLDCSDPVLRLICSICDDHIWTSQTYYTGNLTVEVASQILDLGRPELVPAWTQLQDGRVELTICAACVPGLGEESMQYLTAKVEQ